jgi:hypothetical protein
MRKLFGCVAVILMTALVLSGCPTTSSNDGPEIWKDCDIVVVGAGIAGSTAALAAVEGYAQVKVILIDINPVAGGSLYRADGVTTNNPPVDLVDPITNAWNSAKLTTYKNATVNVVNNANSPLYGQITGYPNFDLVGLIAKEGRATWEGTLNTWGIGYVDPTNNNPYYKAADGTNTPPSPPGYVSGGYYNTAIQAAEHVEFIGGCKATDLYLENGVISGVKVEYDGQNHIIKAKKTILATGGFTNNSRILSDYISDAFIPNISKMATYIRSTSANPSDGTTLLPAIKEAGGAFSKNWTLIVSGSKYDDSLGAVGQLSPAFIQPRFATGPQLQMYDQIWVNVDGVRFATENRGISYGFSPYDSNLARTQFNDGEPPYWIIFNQNNPNIDTRPWYLAGIWGADSKVDLTAALNAAAALNNGEVVKADTIDALAQRMFGTTNATAIATFKSTITRYNTFVDHAAGLADTDTTADSDFGKRADRLIKKFIDGDPNHGGPFYAIKVYPDCVTSIGGPVIDHNCRVLSEELPFQDPTAATINPPSIPAGLEEVVIPNLYAAGEFADRGLYGPTYPGGCLAWYPVMGRIAGIHAAKAIANP